MEPIEIYTSKKKFGWILVASTIFVSIGVWMVMMPESFCHWIPGVPVFTRIIGAISVLFFGFGIYLGIKKMIKSDLSLFIDFRGICIYPGKAREELITWNQVIKFNEVYVHNQKFIAIIIKDPKQRIESETNRLMKKLMQFNLNNYGSPFCLVANGLEVSHHALMDIVTKYFENYKRIHRQEQMN
jgi:hypothetical protein